MQMNEKRGRISATPQPRRNQDAGRQETPTLEQFITKTTGLPREQVLKLYRAGYPWPLRTIYEVQKAGIIAQAEGLPFPAALEKAESMTEEQAEAYSDSLNGDDRAKGQGTSSEVEAALASLLFLHEIGAHRARVNPPAELEPDQSAVSTLNNVRQS